GHASFSRDWSSDVCSSDLAFVAIRSGGSHSCGLTAAGDAYCWGGNDGGALGNGTAGGKETEPTAVVGGHVFQDLALGWGFTCGLDDAGEVWCWGMGKAALGLGPGAPWENPTPQKVSIPTEIQAISAFSAHVCALEVEGAVWCWGQGESGQLGLEPGLPP